MSRIIPRPKPIIKRTERHIRWNWEKSPDDLEMVRYHFIVVDDKDRDMIMNGLLEKLLKVGPIEFPLQLIRSRQGKVLNSELRYLFQTYDSQVNPSRVRFTSLSKPIKRDLSLNERVRGNIDNHVKSEYGPMDHKTLS